MSELAKQLHQFIKAPMHIADDVERPVFLFQIIPQRLTLNNSGLDVLQRFQHMDMPETLALQPTQRAMQLLRLLTDDVRAAEDGCTRCTRCMNERSGICRALSIKPRWWWNCIGWIARSQKQWRWRCW